MALEYAWTWRPSLQSRPNRHAGRTVRLVLMIYELRKGNETAEMIVAVNTIYASA